MGKKIFLVLAMCAFCTAIKAQSPTAYEGKILNKGDVLTIGYHSVTSSDYITIREKVVNQFGREQYLNVKDDMTFSEVRIVDVITPENTAIFPNKNLIVLARDEKRNKDLYIEIDKAIEKGEVVGELLPDGSKEAVFLSDDLLMACMLRVNKIPITDNILLAFISVNDKELYRRCLSDEFELNKAKSRYAELLNKLMDGFDFSTTYYIKAPLEMDKYDFSAGAYPLALFPKESKISTFLPYGDYQFIVEKGREQYRLLPVTPEKAESANKRRKGTEKYGFISPRVYGKFYLKLLDRRMELPQNPPINMENVYRHRVVGAELMGLEVYDFQHCEYNFIGSIR